jgi:hypothetical protein
MRPRPRRQRDLFGDEKPAAEVPTILKATVVRRIGELLVEAIRDGKARTGDNSANGRGHEQDHI